jgi:hypothetical protein
MGVVCEVPQVCERCGDAVVRRQWVLDADWVIVEHVCMCTIHSLTMVRNVRAY